MFYIRGRKLWGAQKPRTAPTRDDWEGGVKLVVHHTADAGPGKNTIFNERRHLQAMQRFHQKVRGWSDIGYNYIIMPSGRVYEGRGYGVRGAHVAGHNTNSCGVSFVGTYTHQQPSAAAVKAFHQLKQRLAHRGARFTGVVGHGDLMPTACPGAGVRRALKL